MAYKVFTEKGARPIKAWVGGVHIDDNAKQQLVNTAKLPFIHKWVAAMPDVHWGMGATIGSVVPTKGAIVPAAVGVDIGCGMCAVKTSLKGEDLPDNLAGIRSAIERNVPHGRTITRKCVDRGAWANPPEENVKAFETLDAGCRKLIDKHPTLKRNAHPLGHLGTLGSGNHFIEVCLDEDGHVWFMLHSGSRGIGNRIGQHFIRLAKEDMRKHHKNVPDENLAYLKEGAEHFDDYVEAVHWAQESPKAMLAGPRTASPPMPA